MENADESEPFVVSSDDRDSTLSNEEIEILAHDKWVKRGRPENSSWQDWFQAREELGQLKQLAKRLAKELHCEDHQFLHGILDNARAVIYLKDTLGRYVFANREFENLCHGEHMSWAGKTDYDLFPATSAADFCVNDLKVLGSARSLEFEEALMRPDGMHTFRSIKFPLVDAEGLPYAICGIMTDITEQRHRQLQWELSCRVAETLAVSASLEEACANLLQIICESLRWSVGALWVVEGNPARLICESTWHFPHLDISEFIEQTAGMRFGQGQGLPGRVWESGAPLWITNVADDPSLTRYRLFQNEELHAAVAFPIKDGAAVVGVMEFFSRQIQEPDGSILTLMSNLGSQISQYIHRGQAERVLHERDHEFALARRIQGGLLPTGPPAISGFEIAGFSRPAQETGGDYYDYFPLPDGTWAIAIADASGHGIAAALLMAETRSFVRALALAEHDVNAILLQTNQHFVRDVEGGHFVTFLLACLDPKDRSLVCANAGHPPGYLLDSQGNTRYLLESTGWPLGLLEDATYPRAEAKQMQSGDLVFLYTDGIVEALDPTGSMIGKERVLDIVRHSVTLSPEELIRQVDVFLQACTQGRQLDDMTMVCLKAL